MLEKKAYAKVNLSLDIVGLREDGYHLVRMVMQSLDIFDVLTFEKLEKPEIVVLLNDTKVEGGQTEKGNLSEEAKSNGERSGKDEVDSAASDNLGKVPLDENNLIYKVAKLLFEKYIWLQDKDAGVKITLTKNIPIAAGMAGGSSDAAATFRGINELFELNLMDKELMEMGVTLGADIPYCIMGGTALSEGIGEVLTKLPDMPKCYYLVAKPPISVSTGEAYGGYDRLTESIKHPDVDGQVDAIYAGDLKGVTDRFSNVLEFVTARNHKEIGVLEKMMLEGGALNSMMSGSGPTVFGIFDNEEKAEAVKAEIVAKGLADQVFVTIAV